MDIHRAIELAQYYNGEKQTDETYFDIGTSYDKVVNNSALGAINPDEGGSPVKFDMYFEAGEEVKTINHLEKGKLFHRYCKDSRNFVVEDSDRPSDTVCGIIDMVISEMNQNADVPVPQGLITPFDQLKDLVIESARAVGWNSGWGDDAIFRNLKKDGEKYFNFVRENNDKIIMSKDVKASVDGMKLSIENSPHRDFVLDTNDNSIYKELPIFWAFPTEFGTVRAKSLLDNVQIDEEARIITITDYKSTSKPVSTYMGTTRYGLDPVEGSPRKIYIDGPFQYFRVYRQLASYGEAFRRAILNNMPTGGQWSIRYAVLAIESKEPFENQLFWPRTSWLRLGMEEYTSCMNLVGKHLQSNEQD